jgi:hypothetical protein
MHNLRNLMARERESRRFGGSAYSSIHSFIQYRRLTVTQPRSQSRIWVNCYHCTYPYAYKTNECFGISNDKIHNWNLSPRDDDRNSLLIRRLMDSTLSLSLDKICAVRAGGLNGGSRDEGAAAAKIAFAS